MNGQNSTGFKFACTEYLSTLGHTTLRPLGRMYGVEEPTKKKKHELIEEIVAILLGEKNAVAQSNRGAPIKNSFVEPKIIQDVAALQWKYLGVVSKEALDFNFLPTTMPNGEPLPNIATDMKEFLAREPEYLFFSDSVESVETEKTECVGQLQEYNRSFYLWPLNAPLKTHEILVPVGLVNEYGLREGDVISCYTESLAMKKVVKEILSVNGLNEKRIARNRFEEYEVSYPKKQIRFVDETQETPLLSKYMEWVFSLRHGQRGFLVSPPKAGKTIALYQLAKTAAALNPDLEVLVLLLEQPLETVAQFKRSVKESNFIYTTYEESCADQLFKAEFILKRAKAFAECGKDVLLLVDSLNALARVYNDSDYSQGGKTLTGGLESKTLQYVKKYFSSGRCLEGGGSITVLASLAFNTGNPFDDFLTFELLPLANLEISLSDELARRQQFPAVEYAKSRISLGWGLDFAGEDTSLQQILRSSAMLERGETQLRELLTSSRSFMEWKAAVINSAKR